MNAIPFVEQDCTIKHEGQTFEQAGAWLCDCTDGYRRGVVYVRPAKRWDGCGCPPIGKDNEYLNTVTTWHGEFTAIAEFGPVYRGNFCRMQHVAFTLDGIKYSGRYCPDWAQAVRVRSTKKIAS
jgi:hypothetical protein